MRNSNEYKEKRENLTDKINLLDKSLTQEQSSDKENQPKTN